ncbi:MAG: YbaK/EbsC family protein [Acidimicrobiales bacterium]
MTSLPASAERVMAAAREHGLELEVIEYPDGTRTAPDAAAAVGCDVGQIVKSLIFAVDGDLVLALTSGSNRVDTAALTELAGGSTCDRADADRVREITGYAIGGVPPFGHANPVTAFLDPALLDYDVVWAAAGTPRHVFPIDPTVLASITGAAIGSFAER